MSLVTTSLNAVGISRAAGVDLFVLRDQLNATLPTGGDKAQKPAVAAAAKNEPEPSTTEAQARPTAKPGPRELSPEERRIVAELQQIDRAVRAHEQAHLQAGGGVITSGANYNFTYGPDGRQYAVGGEVGIDTSPEKQAQANIDKGIAIQAAALAPRDPSAQDFRVAAIGSQLQAQGQSELAREQIEERALDAERSARSREQALRQVYVAPEVAAGTAAPGDTVSVFA